jgi:hypothetical protein
VDWVLSNFSALHGSGAYLSQFFGQVRQFSRFTLVFREFYAFFPAAKKREIWRKRQAYWFLGKIYVAPIRQKSRSMHRNSKAIFWTLGKFDHINFEVILRFFTQRLKNGTNSSYPRLSDNQTFLFLVPREKLWYDQPASYIFTRSF